jgi:hypothetical protein
MVVSGGAWRFVEREPPASSRVSRVQLSACRLTDNISTIMAQHGTGSFVGRIGELLRRKVLGVLDCA